ncbi:hypothetical protein [Burkholderia semiarida]|nr:hypothetical protein [Burkholderia semiarida]
MFDVLQAAFAQVVPDAIPALGAGGNWLIIDGILGSWGGGGRNDGTKALRIRPAICRTSRSSWSRRVCR